MFVGNALHGSYNSLGDGRRIGFSLGKSGARIPIKSWPRFRADRSRVVGGGMLTSAALILLVNPILYRLAYR